MATYRAEISITFRPAMERFEDSIGPLVGAEFNMPCSMTIETSRDLSAGERGVAVQLIEQQMEETWPGCAAAVTDFALVTP